MKVATEVNAAPGEKMIVVEVRFFTRGLAKKSGHVRQKHAWVNGTMNAKKNDSHGIGGKKNRNFNSLLSLPSTLEAVLKDNGIVLHAYKTRTIDVKP
jgi:hypothetical protein